jgi:hypothetical protein
MDSRMQQLVGQAKKEPGATEEAIQKLLAYAGVALPEDYLQFLRWSNGIEGPIGDHGYFALYSAEEILEANEGYGLPDSAPGFLLVGTDRGGTGFALDIRSKNPRAMEYVEMDFIFLDPDEIGTREPSLFDFLTHLSRAGA